MEAPTLIANPLAPSDEGAVSVADWGRDRLKNWQNIRKTGEIQTFSLPQSPAATALCGAPSAAALTAHRAVIHYRSDASFTLVRGSLCALPRQSFFDTHPNPG